MANVVPPSVLEAQAMEVLHADLVPGTEVMRDIGDLHFEHGSKSGVVLIPQPSHDPKDPLNWSMAWKYTVIATQFCFLFVSVESALSMSPMFPLLAEEFNLEGSSLSLLTGACVIALGYSNFIIVPISNIFGRRITSIGLCCLGLATCIWQALATSHSSILGARIVNGVATATSETIMVQVISDMLFLHERGMWTGVYFMGYFLGLFIGPVISGNIAERYGWRSFFWLSLAMTGFNLITLVFCFPETKYNRNISTQPPLHTEDNLEKKIPSDSSAQVENIEEHNPIGRGRPEMAQFKLWQNPDPKWKSLLIRDGFIQIHAFILPIVLWAGLNVAGPANILLFWNLTESTVLAAPPYNFSASSVGYANFAFVVGGVIGLLTAGPVSDWIAMKATIRNNGVREAEMRLPALIPYTIISIVGIVIGGIGYDRQWNWPIILVVGYGFSGLCVTSVPTIAVAYAVDCYKPISGEIMVVATVIKNTCGFAMSYWVSPMAQKRGWVVPTMVEFALTIGPLILGIPVYFFGKRLRKLSRGSPVHSCSA